MHLETGSQASKNAVSQHKEPTHTPLSTLPNKYSPPEQGPTPLVQGWARSGQSQPSWELGLMWWARLPSAPNVPAVAPQTQNPASPSLPKKVVPPCMTCHCVCVSFLCHLHLEEHVP